MIGQTVMPECLHFNEADERIQNEQIVSSQALPGPAPEEFTLTGLP